jgi:hypothetical protein
MSPYTSESKQSKKIAKRCQKDAKRIVGLTHYANNEKKVQKGRGTY